MRVAAGRDDIPCCAFVPAGDATKLEAYLRWTESVTYPEVQQILVDIPGGLLPMRYNGSSRMLLIVKAMREFAATAQLRKSFRFYLVLCALVMCTPAV